jgi:hypothetical protein
MANARGSSRHFGYTCHLDGALDVNPGWERRAWIWPHLRRCVFVSSPSARLAQTGGSRPMVTRSQPHHREPQSASDAQTFSYSADMSRFV